MRNHGMAVFCAIGTSCPNNAQAMLCLRVNLDDRVLVPPCVTHPATDPKRQGGVLDLDGTPGSKTSKPSGNSFA